MHIDVQMNDFLGISYFETVSMLVGCDFTEFPSNAFCEMGDLVKFGNFFGIVVGWAGYHLSDEKKTKQAPLVMQLDGYLSCILNVKILLKWMGET